MGIVPDDFGTHAERTADEFEDEVSYRSAISRKYYYAYHFVKTRGDGRHGVNFKGDSKDHQRAIKLVKRVADKDLADDLRTLRRKRNEADYDIDDQFDDMDWAMFNIEVDDFILEFKQRL